MMDILILKVFDDNLNVWHLSASTECSSSHDIVKIISRNVLVIGSSSFQHFKEFLMTHGFSELLGDSLDAVNVNHSGIIGVEEVKYFIDAVLN